MAVGQAGDRQARGGARGGQRLHQRGSPVGLHGVAGDGGPVGRSGAPAHDDRRVAGRRRAERGRRGNRRGPGCDRRSDGRVAVPGGVVGGDVHAVGAAVDQTAHRGAARRGTEPELGVVAGADDLDDVAGHRRAAGERRHPPRDTDGLVARGRAQAGRLPGGGHPVAGGRLLAGEQFVGVEQAVAGVVVLAGRLDVDRGRLHRGADLGDRLRRVQRAVAGEDAGHVRCGHRGAAHELVAARVGGRRRQHRRPRGGDEVGRAAVAVGGRDPGVVRRRHGEGAGRGTRVGGGVAVEPVVAGRGDDDDVVGHRVLDGGVVGGVAAPAEAHVDDRGAVVDGVDDGVGDVRGPARAVGAEHPDRQDLRGAHPGDADAVAGDRADRCRRRACRARWGRCSRCRRTRS